MSASSTTSHPYYPPDLRLSGASFAPNTRPVSHLVTSFAALCALLLGATLLTVRRLNPRVKPSDQALVLWFVLTGSIHCFFEGYFVYNSARMADMTDLFGQLWKEYALSDSRYMASDPFLLCIETCTVFTWGPLSLLAAVLITVSSSYRYPVQALVSTGQFYGNLLYFSTSLFEDLFLGRKYYRPEPFYFWVYFVGMNSIWLVIPGYCLWTSIRKTSRAFREQRGFEKRETVKKRL